MIPSSLLALYWTFPFSDFVISTSSRRRYFSSHKNLLMCCADCTIFKCCFFVLIGGNSCNLIFIGLNAASYVNNNYKKKMFTKNFALFLHKFSFDEIWTSNVCRRNQIHNTWRKFNTGSITMPWTGFLGCSHLLLEQIEQRYITIIFAWEKRRK